MADKTKELENRLNRLEDRLKATFLEVEKRFESLNVSEPAVTVIEQRVQEVEDLLLLLQIEVAKLKETVGSGFEFNPAMSSSTGNVPGVNTRLKKMEDDIEILHQEKPSARYVSHEPLSEKLEEVNTKLKELEENIASLSEKSVKVQKTPANTERITRQLDEIEERLEKLEREKELTPIGVGVLEDVRRILHS